MQAVSVQTTQNIRLDYPLAGIGDRLLSFAIDLLIILSFFLITSGLATLLPVRLPAYFIYIILIVAYLYRLVSEVLFNGQTIGKNALKIRVVKLDGSPPSFASFFLRWLMEPIDFLIVGLGVLCIILNKNGQRIGDMLAGTTVVKIRKITATNVRNKIIMEPVDDRYRPVYPEAAQLSDGEITLIKEALRAYREDAVKKPMVLVEDKLKQKYGIQSEDTPVKFLYTLLRDHTYYTAG